MIFVVRLNDEQPINENSIETKNKFIRDRVKLKSIFYVFVG